MSRHRDVRCMNYSDEYDEYDDVYGHSVEDDYCVSPSAEQFLYDRSKQQNIASFITEPDIIEDNEDPPPEEPSSTNSKCKLSEAEAAKLESCMESVRNVIGDVAIPESELKSKIIETDFNAESTLDWALRTSCFTRESAAVPKDCAEQDFPGKKAAAKTTTKATFQGSNDARPLSCTTTVKVIPAGTHPAVKGFDLSGTEGSVEAPVMTTAVEAKTAVATVTPAKSNPFRPRSPAVCQNCEVVKRRDGKEEKEGEEDGKEEAGSTKRRDDKKKPSVSPIGGDNPTTESAELVRLRSSGEERQERVDALAMYKSKRGSDKEQLHLVVVGHVDAGKSTLLGRLLCDLGQVSSKLIHKYQQESKKMGKQSFAFAWVLDETGEERRRGITMDVGHSQFETKTKRVTLLDAPGHKDFIPNMITGAAQADVALLVVDATRGEFETGFDSGGQTREHALLLRSLGVSQIAVVVNKLDTVNWSMARFNEIVDKMSVFLKQAGYKDTAVPFVPCSGLSGENVVIRPKEPLSSWYTGPTLFEAIDGFKCPERPVQKPFRLSVNDIFKGTSSGFRVSGYVETGMVSAGDKVLVLPRNEVAVVKGLQREDISTTSVFAGDAVALTLSGIDQQNVGIGNIVCDPLNPVPVTTRFHAHVVVFAVSVPITRGLAVVLHQQSLMQPAVVTRLIAQLHRETGETIKKRPRCLPKNSSAVIEVVTQSPVCLELYRDIKQLGRIMLRVEGTTIAAGLVTKIG